MIDNYRKCTCDFCKEFKYVTYKDFDFENPLTEIKIPILDPIEPFSCKTSTKSVVKLEVCEKCLDKIYNKLAEFWVLKHNCIEEIIPKTLEESQNV